MSFLLRFPNCIVREVCSDLLEIADIVRLDSAHCSGESRHAFLCTAYSGEGSQESPNVLRIAIKPAAWRQRLHLVPKKTNWLTERKAVADTLFVRLDEVVFEWDLPSIPKVNQLNITKLVLYSSSSWGSLFGCQGLKGLMSSLPNLDTLELVNGTTYRKVKREVVDDILRAVQHVKLRNLKLSSVLLRPAYLETICTKLAELTSLDISGSVALSSVPNLAELTHLQRLNMPEMAITDEIGQKIALPSLQTLNVSGSITAGAMNTLGTTCTHMAAFTLNGYVKHDSNVTSFTFLWPQLKYVRFCRLHSATPRTFHYPNEVLRRIIQQCPMLTTIIITVYSSETIANIGICHDLETLVLCGEGQAYSCAVLAVLGVHCPKLHTFKVCAISFDQWTLASFVHNCPSLRTLYLHECDGITDDALRVVGRNEQSLHSLELSLRNISDDGVIEILRNNSGLSRLNLSGCTQLTDATLQAVAQMCPNLRMLDISNCDKVTETGLYAVALDCPRLHKLQAGTCKGVDGNCWDNIRRSKPWLSVVC